MEGTEEVREVTWDDVNLEGNWFKFEKGIRTKILIRDWRKIKKKAKKFESEDMELKVFFEATVLEQDNETCDKKLSISSAPFLRAVKLVLPDGMDNKKPTLLSVKKLGERNTTTYDVELININ